MDETTAKLLTENVNKLTESVNELVKAEARREEREENQRKINDDMLSRIVTIESNQHTFMLQRAEEKRAREWLQKAFPWLFIIVTIAGVALSVIVRDFIMA